jgi:flagellar hook protein FlgE
MMRSLFSGVAGLRNHQTAMDVIGANISNVNTTGYKGSTANFSDVISQTLQGAAGATGNRGGTNAMQVGLGVGLASISTNFGNGSYQSTGKQTDLAIQNDGFFILSDGDKQYYTRAGNFDFDSAGNFLSGTGLKVMGWQADATGAINTTGATVAIQVPKGTMMPALASTSLTFANNLSADASQGASAVASLPVYDSLGNAHNLAETFTKVGGNTWLAKASLPDESGLALTNTMTLITFDTAGKLSSVEQVTPTPAELNKLTLDAIQMDSTTSSVNSQYYTTFDSNNTPHVMKITYTQAGSATPNQWKYSLSEAGSTSTTPLATGTVTWDGTSTYTFSPATASVTVGSSTMTFAANSLGTQTAPAAGACVTTSDATYSKSTTVNPVTFTGAGAAQSKISVDVSTLTQYGGDSTVQATKQNGYAAGALDSTSIDSTGVIVGKFSNGRTQNLGQVALATFNNPPGLLRIGDSLFGASNNSGSPSVGTVGTGGRGTLTAGSLEMSNIDLADQFSKMIITQRGFQANSKIITTSDTMLEELVNLKR